VKLCQILQITHSKTFPAVQDELKYSRFVFSTKVSVLGLNWQITQTRSNSSFHVNVCVNVHVNVHFPKIWFKSNRLSEGQIEDVSASPSAGGWGKALQVIGRLGGTAACTRQKALAKQVRSTRKRSVKGRENLARRQHLLFAISTTSARFVLPDSP
jgi:hypothetical protein